MLHDPFEFEAGQRNDKEYNGMLKETLRAIVLFANRRSKNLRILETGAGTGLFSEVYVPKFPQAEIVISEPDEAYVSKIPPKFKGYRNITYIQSVAEKLKWNGKFDVVVATESYHHIPDKEKVKFFENVYRLLDRDGIVVIGDNFIPRYNVRSTKDRIRALHDFWDPYINEKKRRGDREGVKTFSNALREAESGSVEYKTSMEVFEKLAVRCGFKISIKKELSHDINKRGGYVVYVLKKKK